MKNASFCKIIMVGVSFGLLSCATTKKTVTVEPAVQQSDGAAVDAHGDAGNAAPSDSGSGATAIKIKIPVQTNKPVRLMKADPISLDTTSFFVYDLTGVNISSVDCDVSFEPKTNLVCLKYKFLAGKYYVYLNRLARISFKDSFAKYQSDFDAHVLEDSSKTYDVYGKAPGEVKWGTFTINGDAVPDMSFGYRFKKVGEEKSPYFTITMWPSENINEQQKNTIKESEKIVIFFTRAQAERLCTIMEEGGLEKILDGLEAEQFQSKVDSASDSY